MATPYTKKQHGIKVSDGEKEKLKSFMANMHAFLHLPLQMSVKTLATDYCGLHLFNHKSIVSNDQCGKCSIFISIP